MTCSRKSEVVGTDDPWVVATTERVRDRGNAQANAMRRSGIELTENVWP